MSQWRELILLLGDDEDKKQDANYYYKEIGFPVTVREYCASWIEDQTNWTSQDVDGHDILYGLRNEMRTKLDHMTVQQLFQEIQEKFQTDHALVEAFQQILNKENEWISKLSEGIFPDKHQTLRLIEKWEPEINKIQASLKEWEEMITALQVDQNPKNVAEKAPLLLQCYATLVSCDDYNQGRLDMIWLDMKESLQIWKRCQQVQFITEEDPINLHFVQKKFEILAEVLITCLDHLAKLKTLSKTKLYRNELAGVTGATKNLIKDLIQRSFIIEKQSPQNLKNISSSKKGSKFHLSVRFLVGNVLLGKSQKPTVKVSFHCEKSLAEPDSEPHKHGSLLHPETKLVCKNMKNECSCLADFTDLTLIAYKRCEEKKAVEEVSERKYGFKVETTVQFQNETIMLQEVTLPVIVTTQTSQDWSATATLLWDSAFSGLTRPYYTVPETVQWPKLGRVLSKRFQTTTGRGLSQSQLHALAGKISGQKLQDYSSMEVSWKWFNKDKRTKDFTFWKWFYAVNNLVKKHLQKPWRDGLIEGFIDKKEVKRRLCACDIQDGTFLLRFSENKIDDSQGTHFGGGLCVAYKVTDQVTGQPNVEFVYPFMASQFELTPFCDYLQNLEIEDEPATTYKKSPLNYLFPNMPFLRAFGECIQYEKESLHKKPSDDEESQEEEEENYKKCTVKRQIRRTNNGGMQSSPQSPASSLSRGITPHLEQDQPSLYTGDVLVPNTTSMDITTLVSTITGMDVTHLITSTAEMDVSTNPFGASLPTMVEGFEQPTQLEEFQSSGDSFVVSGSGDSFISHLLEDVANMETIETTEKSNSNGT